MGLAIAQTRRIMYPYYVDIVTDWKNGITLVNQRCWLVENNIDNIYHVGTNSPADRGQYNRWRFANKVDAMAFKLRWVE